MEIYKWLNQQQWTLIVGIIIAKLVYFKMVNDCSRYYIIQRMLMDVNGVKLPASTPFRRRKHWCCSLQQKISTGRDCQCYEMSVNRYHEPCRSRGVSCDQGHHLAAEQIFSAEDVNQRMYMTFFSRCESYRSWRRWLAAAETKPTHITGGEPPARGINQQRYFLDQQQLIPTPEKKNIFPTIFFYWDLTFLFWELP